MTNTSVNGQKLRIAVLNSGKTREKVVVLVQEIIKKDGLSFSFTGLTKLLDGELPKKDGDKILEALSQVLGLPVSDFAESDEIKTA